MRQQERYDNCFLSDLDVLRIMFLQVKIMYIILCYGLMEHCLLQQSAMPVPLNAGGYSSQQMVLAKMGTCQQENPTQGQRVALGPRKVGNTSEFHVHRLRESILNALTEQQKAVLVTLPMEKRRAFIKTYVEVCAIDSS